VIVPNVETGADIGDRDPKEVTLSAQVFAITGTGEEREEAREAVRDQIGSTVRPALTGPSSTSTAGVT